MHQDELIAEYNERWEKNRHLYPPDPALDAIYQQNWSLIDAVRELERITKGKANQ